jgi:hypothetical protein
MVSERGKIFTLSRASKISWLLHAQNLIRPRILFTRELTKSEILYKFNFFSPSMCILSFRLQKYVSFIHLQVATFSRRRMEKRRVPIEIKSCVINQHFQAIAMEWNERRQNRNE